MSEETLNQTEPSSSKEQDILIQVEQVKDIAHENIEKIMNRGAQLKDIHSKAGRFVNVENLDNVGGLFKSKAKKVLNQEWFRSLRVKHIHLGKLFYLGVRGCCFVFGVYVSRFLF